MEQAVRNKLLTIVDEYNRLTEMMSSQEVASNPGEFRKCAKAQKDLEDLVQAFRRYEEQAERFRQAEQILHEESDPELRQMADEERRELAETMRATEEDIKFLVLPKDPNDAKNTIIEIRAGTGGDEAALFVADLFRMYSRLAELKGWKVEILSQSATGIGGYKEIVFKVAGDNVYSHLKYEAGVHRVQRVPATEAQGRIHTSAVTVAVLAEAEEVDLHIDPSDIQIDLYRSSGAGGQHVNTTDSAVRLTHIPTGVVVTCQDERSQHKNRAKAMSILRSRILASMQEAEEAQRSAERKSQVRSGDRSERIRTYNFPQNRITDHRINFTLYQLEQAMEGEIQELIDALIAADRAAQLSET